jgi:quinol-cytochrome oxidoreductase complex cytochrome b subunit
MPPPFYEELIEKIQKEDIRRSFLNKRANKATLLGREQLIQHQCSKVTKFLNSKIILNRIIIFQILFFLAFFCIFVSKWNSIEESETSFQKDANASDLKTFLNVKEYLDQPFMRPKWYIFVKE